VPGRSTICLHPCCVQTSAHSPEDDIYNTNLALIPLPFDDYFLAPGRLPQRQLAFLAQNCIACSMCACVRTCTVCACVCLFMRACMCACVRVCISRCTWNCAIPATVGVQTSILMNFLYPAPQKLTIVLDTHLSCAPHYNFFLR